METAPSLPPLVIAVVDANAADVYFMARVLQVHGVPYILQVLENRPRALLQSIKAMPVCQHLRVIVTTGSEDPTVHQAALACGADAFFQKPVSFHRFMALGDLIKAVAFGHRQA
jgi:response regulator RpfG family c-di-GMP phosphodiesterase